MLMVLGDTERLEGFSSPFAGLAWSGVRAAKRRHNIRNFTGNSRFFNTRCGTSLYVFYLELFYHVNSCYSSK
jgi:hypothetical protein